jgi:thiamine-phosphate pyrophosphorylase
MKDSFAEQLRLMLITDRQLFPAGAPELLKAVEAPPMLEAVEAALEGGVTAVQLREPDLSARELYELALPLRELTKLHGAALIVNDRIDVALAVGADAVQLGWRSLNVAAARAVAGERIKIGFSAHGLADAQRAAQEGADYLILGSVFPTPSKVGLVDVLGLEQLAAISSEIALPIVGVGGIDSGNARQVIEAGARGVAVIRAILGQSDPARAARELAARLPHGGPSSLKISQQQSRNQRV